MRWQAAKLIETQHLLGAESALRAALRAEKNCRGSRDAQGVGCLWRVKSEKKALYFYRFTAP